MGYDGCMTKTAPHIFFDFDSTVVTKESLDMVIEHALAESPERERLVAEVETITNAGMEGDLPFTESLLKRFAVVPLHREHFVQIGQVLLEHITPGMPELFSELQQQGISPYIISGGFCDAILPVAEKLGVPAQQVFANTVSYDQSGQVQEIHTDNVCFADNGKAPVIEHIKKAHQLTGLTMMIGDGANDFKSYELGVADRFCGFTANIERDIIKELAPATAGSVVELRSWILSELTAEHKKSPL